MTKNQIELLITIRNEMENLISCRRIVDASTFINGLYTSADFMDKKNQQESEWWGDVEPCELSNFNDNTEEKYTPMLPIFGPKPEVCNLNTMSDFKSQIEKSLELQLV